jgi:hypothetical protein
VAYVQRVQISVQRDKRTEVFELQAGVLRVGSAAHCDIRLAPSEADPEQLSLAADGGGLWVDNLGPSRAVRIGDQPLTRALVQDSTRITLGSVVLGVQLLAAAPSARVKTSALKRLRQLAMIVAASAAYYAAMHNEPTDTAFDHTTPIPLLFAAPSLTKCPHNDAATAHAYADQQLMAAQAKRERSPYNARDGVLAVPLYDAASACFDVAGQRDAAAQASDERAQLAQHLQENLRSHQVQLEWSLERHRYQAAAQEVRRMQELLAGRSDSHAHWIAAVALELGVSLH